MKIIRVGIDLAKNVFQVHGLLLREGAALAQPLQLTQANHPRHDTDTEAERLVAVVCR